MIGGWTMSSDFCCHVVAPLKVNSWKLGSVCEKKAGAIHDMLSKYLEQKDVICKILLETTNSPECLTAEEHKALIDVLPILNHFKEKITKLSSETNVTVSKLIPYVRLLIENITKMDFVTDGGKAIQALAIHEITRRLEFVNSMLITVVSTILDPRYKKIHFVNPLNCSKGIVWIKRIIQNDILVKSSQNSGRRRTDIEYEDDDENVELQVFTAKKARAADVYTYNEDIVQTEISSYLTSGVISKGSPLVFWETNKAIYPHLYQVAQRFLCITNTSTPTERSFSECGNIVTKKRSRLTPEHVNNLLFLHSLSKQQ